MSKEDPYRDQAERLRKKIDRNREHAPVKADKLPPRSELHRQKQSKNKWKLKYPVLRMLVLFFILLPISIFSAYNYLDGKNSPANTNIKETTGFETIDVEGSVKKNTDGQEDSEEETITEDEEMPAEQPDVQVDPSTPPPATVPDNAGNKTAPEPVVQDDNEPAPQAVQPDSGSGSETIYHTVGPGETLYRIAMKYYNSKDGIETIRKANNIKGNEVNKGQVLKIPKDN
ncbi:LysM peptidoglycan-binding domain-containing protein [Bacillus sp. T33-2]|uniref:LysM peptidoglycan-binding domain-containing protein n=1 Tax=Bacillus sp. T33-2 TaxID=2054168 RepID=UPI000C77AF71|nr:LysM domain-containing protein [Bacillus sp. T33-2]PLR99780.1 peptidoglycan-binding protein LysM [Bacillus sp. T33-2]